MINTIDITLLPAELREQVLAKYRVALMEPSRAMSYHEAAWLYGYTYASIRCMVCIGRLRSTGRKPNKKITHAAMRAYIASKKRVGTPRKSLRNRQLRVQ